MSESQSHIDLVQLLYVYLETVLLIDSGHILVDTPEISRQNKPPLIRDFRPDIYAKVKGTLFIGDAKTESDWDRKHSLDQYRAYVHECITHKGSSILLIAVPWHIERSVRSRLKRMFPKESNQNLTIVVISDMWRV